MTAFAYSPSKAEEIKVGIESDLAKARHAVNRLKARIPSPGAMGSRCEDVVTELDEIAGDLQAEVDRRTDADGSRA